MNTTRHIIFSHLALLGIALYLMACGTSKNVTAKKDVPIQEKPAWVDARPVSQGYYIGIGAASKVSQPLDYATVAQKNALADLANGISVRVQGQTFLNSLDINKNFSEEFISTISTTTNEQVDDYEIAGQYETDKEFWVYYRLSKSEYMRKKLEKKNQALSASYDYYLKGKEAESSMNLPQAIDLYFHGLFELQEYWNDVNEYSAETGKVYLDNELYSSIQRVVTGLYLQPQSKKVVLSSENNYKQGLLVNVMYNGVAVKNIPVQYKYDTGTYMKPKKAVSDFQGGINVLVANVNTTAKSNEVDLRIVPEELLPSDLDKAITTPLMANMKADAQLVPIEVITPGFYVESNERNFGQPSDSPVLAQSAREALVKRGMQLSGDPNEANYLVIITSNTVEGSDSQGFHVALLDFDLEVRNKRNGEVVYKKSQSNIKGLQLNKASAGMEAYKKGREMIENDIVKSLLEAIL